MRRFILLDVYLSPIQTEDPEELLHVFVLPQIDSA
jgi:hypothetical protein